MGQVLDGLLWHVDWLEVEQDHGAHAPYCSEVGVLRDPDSGELIREHFGWRHHEGPHGSKLSLRSNGSRVVVQKNPSRWGKPEAVFGLRFDEALTVFQEQLALAKLPLFSADAPVLVAGDRPGVDRLIGGGARLRRVDLTCNLATGGPRERSAVLAALQRFRHPRGLPLSVHGDGSSVYFGEKSRQLTVLWYDKAAELRAKRGADEYSEALAADLDSQGVVRLEVRLFERELRALGLRHLSGVTHERLVKAAQVEVLTMSERAEVSDLESVPMPYRLTLAGYLQGLDLRSTLGSSATFYRHRKVLLKFGYDIAVESNVVRMPPRFVEVTLRAAVRPDWYRTAEDWAALDDAAVGASVADEMEAACAALSAKA